LTSDTNEGFIYVPSRRLPLYFTAQTPVNLWAILLRPSPDGRVIHGEAPFRH
jgi:hypothetical protein